MPRYRRGCLMSDVRQSSQRKRSLEINIADDSSRQCCDGRWSTCSKSKGRGRPKTGRTARGGAQSLGIPEDIVIASYYLSKPLPKGVCRSLVAFDLTIKNISSSLSDRVFAATAIRVITLNVQVQFQKVLEMGDVFHTNAREYVYKVSPMS